MKKIRDKKAHWAMRELILVVMILTLVCPPVAAKRRELKPGFNLFSKEQDVQLGKEAAAQIEKQMQVVQNRDLNDFINRIGRKLIARPEADAKSFDYSFKVIHEKSINAFALPGGPAFVHTGLISAADNEAQVAGVLAHEIAHVALRHGTNQASKANLIQLPAMLAGAVAGGSMLGQLAQIGIGLGANSVLLKYSRNAERDADLLGARMMSGAGYNPIEMARFFQKLEAEGGSRSSFEQFLSDHPNPGNRVKAVEEEIKYLPRKTYQSDSSQLERMKQVVSKLPPPKPVAGASAAGNTRAPDIQLSGQFKQHRGQGFSMSYPDTWEVFGARSSSEVTIAPREGILRTQDGSTAIGYGAIVSTYQSDQGRVDLRRDTERLVRQLQQSNPGMRISNGGSRKTKIGGQKALVTMLVSQSPFQGETEIDTLVTAARPGGLFYTILIAPQSRLKRMESTFQEMLRSIRFGR